ncbi:GDP-mannose-dependent alpha-(1-6)-phosphatidylinositol monomannoside mannosyltransferase [bacterium HR17]|uniref:GDP-mannose-dependent alpha-(1-6)-phosphatidylinositol monomannoside mannosyltransferase n=1 Tax=Candidatus Fervidibacter japonicus TaxID=2035412 RepID=A0A2H5XA40_9BACT|nr:GDP-mannose-dependent alpha-(1-6)-phosphatidylinositol monomannoside mannosyltransferase [bacterium HR17]
MNPTTSASKRLLLLAGEFPPFAGGIATAAAHLAKVLVRHGWAVTVIAPRYGQDDRTVDAGQPYRTVRLPLMRLRFLRMVPMTPVIVTLAARWRPDWVIAMRVTREGFPAVAIKQVLGVPFIVFAHALEFLRFEPRSVAWRVCRWVYERADGVAAISSASRAELLQRGLAPEKVHIVHLGVSETVLNGQTTDLPLSGNGKHNGHRVLLTVGRLVPRKGVDKVIEALPLVLREHPDVCYWVVGDGPDRQRLEELAQRLGVADRVAFTGRVPDVRPFLHACEVFVMPTREERRGDVEGFGLVYLEAAACGKPVVASAVGGAVDAVVPDETGLVVNPHDPRAIASALCRLLRDPEFAKRLGEAGRQRVLCEFTWDRTAERLTAIMQPATRGRAKR